jgi:flavin reductase
VTTAQELLIDPTALRRAFGQFATGITIVSVLGPSGPHGMTANSFTSVSLDPPLLLVSVDLRRRAHPLLEQAERFTVSVLSHEHRWLSDRFASGKLPLHKQFEGVPHHLTADGIPLIAGALAHFVCRRYAQYPGGDHTLFLGLIEQLDHAPDTPPLVYFGGRYHELGAQQA